ncbi:putative inositol monophosphatase 3 [Nilaparvata lugens]|uniref:putative inositol monophosphatase 3 n=1 Tax=Nilaparvata lugens TaxID=108931 RepID=UPI00193E86A2|nr:putative inositol monophosphatase 3 [Nilaparvata lugens]XP_022203163.2 putative inositol monophosphatase 3 [Nilaparvata lugens]
MNLGGTIRLNSLGLCLILGLFMIFLLYMTKFSSLSEEEKPADVNLRNILIAAVEAAERGGKEIVNAKKGNIVEKTKGKTKEGANIPVTNADLTSHCVMYNGLQDAFPTVSVFSEETQANCEKSPPLELVPSVDKGMDDLVDHFVSGEDLAIWIDPLDATYEFTENLLQYVSTMVCVAYKGNPIIGVIHKPFVKEPRTTWAWVNTGSSPHIKSYREIKKRPTVIVSRSHAGHVKEIAKEAIGADVEVISAGGAGYKVLELLSGNATAYVHSTKIFKWDICAGHAIVTAARGQMTTLANQPIYYSRASEPSNSQGVLATMDKHQWYADKFKTILDQL